MKRNKGFTLIELLAVIVILAIIALVATPMILSYIDKSKKGADENSLMAIEKAAELYYTSSLLKGENPKIIYFPDEKNVLGIKGTQPTDGMVAFFNNGRIKIIATINNTTYMSEGSGFFGTNHFFNATGSVTATDKEWEYELINDTDVKLTKYIGYKYRYVDEFNDIGVVSKKTYNELRKEFGKTEQLDTYIQASVQNITYPISERKTLTEMLTIMDVDVTGYDLEIKKEGEVLYNLIKSAFANEYENGIDLNNEEECAKGEAKLMKLIEKNKSRIPTVALMLGITGDEKVLPTLFIFPSRLKTSDGTIYNVKSIRPKQMSDGGSCKPAQGLFDDVGIITSCVNNTSSRRINEANYFDKIVVSEGITEIGMIFESMDTKELSLPSTLQILNPLTDYSGYTNNLSLSSLEELVIPSNVEVVKANAIQSDQKSLKSIVFEGALENKSKLKTIEPTAFYLDYKLGEFTINIPGSIQNIYTNSFGTYSGTGVNITTKMNVIINNNDCLNYSLINSDYVTYSCK